MVSIWNVDQVVKLIVHSLSTKFIADVLKS